MARTSNPLEEAGNCTTCGQYAQFRNTAGQCHECHNRQYYERKASRKAELAAQPRCELCSRRATRQIGNLLICGAHLKEAERKLFAGRGVFQSMLIAQAVNGAMVREALTGRKV